jgi:DNA-binding transcriptional ArsR family regulator
MAAALRVRGLFPAERCLLVYLVDRANGDGVCWPSVEEIAHDLELSPRKINQATAVLEQRGLVAVERRYKRSSLFRILEVPAPAKRPNGADDSPGSDEVSAAHSVRSSEVSAAQDRAFCGALSALRIPQESLKEERERTPPPNPRPSGAGGSVLAKKKIKADEETLAWAEREGVADGVADAEGAVADRLASGRLRRATDEQALIREVLRAQKRRRDRPQRRDSWDERRARLLASFDNDEPVGSA